MMNVNIKQILFALAFGLTFASCGDDEANGGNGGGSINTDNVNANTTDKSAYATRLEVPRLKVGNNYQFIAKTDNTIGVNFIIEWDCVTKAQRWTAIHWTKDNTYKNWDRNNWKSGAQFNGYGGNGDPFQPDTEIKQEFRTELSDYRSSGYDRGHMCASEDRICSQNVNGQTFYLSNMHPQVNSFNAGVWSNMESRVRSWRDAVVRNGGELFVCKGGTIYDNLTLDGKTNQPGVAGKIGDGVPVPKYFFMAVLKKTSAGTYSAMAFWAEHKGDKSTDLTKYMITVDELEKRTGYDFFCNLPDKIENSVEGLLTTSEWK